MLRALGILLLAIAAAGLAYNWFALAWDGGTARAATDRILIGLFTLLGVGAGGMIAQQTWGWITCATVAAAVAIAIGFATVSRKSAAPPSVATATRLQELPGNDPQRIAAMLGTAWWASGIDDLRQRERTDNAIAHDWEIQGDGHARVIVLSDVSREARNGDSLPLKVFLLLNSSKGTVIREIGPDFYSEDRNAPVELRLVEERATVALRGEGKCLMKSFSLDRRAGTISPLPDGGC